MKVFSYHYLNLANQLARKAVELNKVLNHKSANLCWDAALNYLKAAYGYAELGYYYDVYNIMVMMDEGKQG